MFQKRVKKNHWDVWPGYVDALATLLMVIIFILLTFVMAQMYLTDAVNNRDEAISTLNKKVRHLDENLFSERERLKDAKGKIEAIKVALSETQDLHKASEEDRNDLAAQIRNLNKKLSQLGHLLDIEETKNKEDELLIRELGENLNRALQHKVEELKQINEELLKMKDVNSELTKENVKFKDLNKVGLYRSEFFAKLKESIGNRNDIRVVGDRFVFQSEVLFELGSALLEKEGQGKLKELSKALKDIIKKIPDDIQWILRVDGHTDQLPIKSQEFPSNWELSTARAISVVKYLIEQGVPEKHLVAAGFGEHQPLVSSDKKDEIAKNRRIEFKLDQR
jgi:chemotaxis protein MotB